MTHAKIDEQLWRHHAWANRIQSLCLLLVMATFFALLGWFLWGLDGVILLLLPGLIAVLVNTSVSPRLIMNLYDAEVINPRQMPELWQIVNQLSQRAELPSPPELYYIPSRMLNSFAAGTRAQSAIALSDGLLRELTLSELVGVLAHEISHIRNNDLWVMGLADMFSRTTSLMAWLGLLLFFINLPLLLISDASINWMAILLLIFAPNLSAIAQLALSRTREFNADLNAVHLTRDPDGLANALIKLEQFQGGWMERIFLPGRRVPVPSLLRTHPETGERIARLMAIKPKLQDELEPWGDLSDLNLNDAFGHPVVRLPRWHKNGLWH